MSKKKRMFFYLIGIIASVLFTVYLKYYYAYVEYPILFFLFLFIVLFVGWKKGVLRHILIALAVFGIIFVALTYPSRANVDQLVQQCESGESPRKILRCPLNGDYHVYTDPEALDAGSLHLTETGYTIRENSWPFFSRTTIYFVRLIGFNDEWCAEEEMEVVCEGTVRKPPDPTPTNGESTTACTQEAKLCPDGSAVGRAGPNCEFAPCSNPNSNNCGNGTCDVNEGPYGCDPAPDGSGCDGYIFCPEDCQ